MTGAEYPFCMTDEITLKTIIRSNPGLLLMKDGMVIRKWSHNALPAIDEQEAALPLEQMEIGSLPDDTVSRKIVRILLWFVLPLALLTIADRLWMWTKWVRKSRRTEELKN
jgi:triosephosphate isomerase